MTLPMELQHASDHFEHFLADLRDTSGLTTRSQVYTMVQGVFYTFRRRLDLRDAIRFANVLPAILRAIFVADWDVDAPPLPFANRAELIREAQSLRQDHNFAPVSCIQDVATVLRRHMDRDALDRSLSSLPEGAADFWRA